MENKEHGGNASLKRDDIGWSTPIDGIAQSLALRNLLIFQSQGSENGQPPIPKHYDHVSCEEKGYFPVYPSITHTHAPINGK